MSAENRSAATERRLPCRCYAMPSEEHKGCWIVTSAAFLCPDKHASRDLVTAEDVRLRRESDAEFDRAEAEWLEQR